MRQPANTAVSPRSPKRSVPNDEEGGETAVFAGLKLVAVFHTKLRWFDPVFLQVLLPSLNHFDLNKYIKFIKQSHYKGNYWEKKRNSI